jgi:hypothetical protein
MNYRVLFPIASLFLCISVSGQKPVKNPVAHGNADGRSEFEVNLQNEINSARKYPKIYSKKLVLRKTRMQGKILRLAGRRGFVTIEGIPAVDGAISHLKTMSGIGELKYSPGLQRAARSQLIDLKDNPSLAHSGKDGSDFGKRLSAYGDTGDSGENITYWDLTPTQVVITMIIDDGQPTRPHRNNVLNQNFNLIGTACGKGKDSRFICVVIFAEKLVKNRKKARSY